MKTEAICNEQRGITLNANVGNSEYLQIDDVYQMMQAQLYACKVKRAPLSECQTGTRE